MKRILCAIAVLAVFGLLSVVSANQDLLTLQTDDNQWAMPGKNYSATRYSTLKQITAANIKNLRQVWSFSTGALRGHEGQPLVVGTTMYVHSAYPNHVYAIDMTKEGWPIKWKYTPVQNDRAVAVACCDLVHRGVNYAQGRIFMTTLDGQVIAIDATTGKEVWKVRNADPTRGETQTMAGLVVKDKFIVGVSGGEFGIRGWVAAYNLDRRQAGVEGLQHGPGQPMSSWRPTSTWRILTTGRFDQGTKTWPGERWKNGGGSTWGWYAYDPELNLLYYSTGNPGTWNPTPRQGDDKWSMTIFARDPDTGMAKWGYQMTPWDAWDYDGINEMVLVDLTIGGKMMKALAHFDRNGFAYLLDRTNGTLLSAEKFCAGDQLGDQHRSEDGAAGRGSDQAHEAGRRTPRTSARPRWAARISSPCRTRRSPS